MHFEDIDQLIKEIDENDGILTISMHSLRNAYGAEKLGVNVRSNITNELASRGIRHIPAELPNYQHERVRLFRLGSPVADIITAATEISEAHDAKLRSLAASNAEEILRRVRELVEP